jgi:hypothetical protein
MDFVFASAASTALIKDIAVSYDICCQWMRNLYRRIPNLPPEWIGLIANKLLRYGIPKFHLPAHGSKCWSRWSLNFNKWWGRTDGEAIERFWALLNAWATASREMSAASRHDFLDAMINAVNFQKIAGLGTSLLYCLASFTERFVGPSLLTKFREAVSEAPKHVAVYDELCATFTAEQVTSCLKGIADWQEKPMEHPDPFQVSDAGTLLFLGTELESHESC